MSVSAWRPPHAYLPGITPRHPQDLFDFLKAGVAACRVQQLPETTAWQVAMELLQEEYFWEAHELLEPLWMACPPNSAEKIYLQSMIQQANAALKLKMGQVVAARKIEQHAQSLCNEARQRAPEFLFGRKWKYNS